MPCQFSIEEKSYEANDTLLSANLGCVSEEEGGRVVTQYRDYVVMGRATSAGTLTLLADEHAFLSHNIQANSALIIRMPAMGRNFRFRFSATMPGSAHFRHGFTD